MNKALNVIAVVVFLVAVASLVLGYMLWDKREELKGRTDQLAQAVDQAVRDQQLQGVQSGLAAIEFEGLEGQLTKFSEQARQKQAVLVNTEQELSDTQQELDITKGTLEATRTNLDEANQTIQDQRQEIGLKNQGLEARDERIAILTDDIQGLMIRAAEADGLRDQVSRLQEEKSLLVSEISRLEKEIGRGLGGGPVTITNEPGVVGTILAVNPDWNFVVVSLGREDNLRPTAQLLVFRGNELVGKLKVSNMIEDNEAIANVEPGWTLGAIREGDNVLY